MLAQDSSVVGVIAIGRNEGERLKECIRSLSLFDRIIYVDSGSTDGSAEWAKAQGVDVVELNPDFKFTAARARNAGFNRLKELAPELGYVQFIDGDCRIDREWPRFAIQFLNDHDKVCAVFGRRRELYPSHSIYNRLCDHEWNVPIGKTKSFGGDVMMRATAFKSIAGYREDLIGGEEPELCVRLRAAGWIIWRLDREMTVHDAAITRFRQWWLRNVRSGYAFAQGAHLHGSPPEQLWVWESRRALMWGLWFPLVCASTAVAFGPPGFALILIYPLQLLRRVSRFSGTLCYRFQFAFFELLGRFPECLGQLKFLRDRLLGLCNRIIEYK